MVDKLPNNPSSPLNQPGAISSAAGVSQSDSKPAGGPAFRALLDKLQQQARSLQQDSETVEKPEDLSGAVDRARSSLTDALSLSDRLLEAYREAQQQNAPPPDGSSGSGE